MELCIERFVWYVSSSAHNECGNSGVVRYWHRRDDGVMMAVRDAGLTGSTRLDPSEHRVRSHLGIRLNKKIALHSTL